MSVKPELIAALQDGTATNEMLAESRGLVVAQFKGWSISDYELAWMAEPLPEGWTPRSHGIWEPKAPDYLNDIRLTLADIEAKGWQWSLVGMADKSGIAVVWSHGDAPRIEAATPNLALNIAYAKAQLAEQENG